MPTFNRLELLRRTMASVFAQTRADWELLAIDDGSTDPVVEWLESLRDPRIRVIRAPHCGRLGWLRNQGIAFAQADWIAFLDSDDLWLPEKLEHQLRYHEEHPNIRWSYTTYTLIDAAGMPINDGRYKRCLPIGGRITKEVLVHDARIAAPAVMVQRSLIAAVGGMSPDLPFVAEYDLWLKLAHAAECAALPGALTQIRMHPANRSREQPELNASFMKIYQRFGALTKSPEHRRICRRQRAFYAVHLARQCFARREWQRAVDALATAFGLRPFYPWGWRTAFEGVWLAVRSGQSKPA